MPHCPSCRESRWIYDRTVPFTGFVTSLTGWRPLECLSCGWRGWRPPAGSRRTPSTHPLLRSLAAAYHNAPPALTRARLAALVRVEHLRARLATRAPAFPAAVFWTISAVALGMLLGVLLLSRDRAATDAESAGPTEGSSGIPVAHVPAEERTVAGPHARPSHEPVVVLAADQEADPEPVALSAPELTDGARSRPTTARAPASRAKPAPSSGALPRYRGALAVDSDPPGARVSLNGQVVGSTPILLRDLPAGSCVVRIEADGYEPWSTAARVVANRQGRVTATLQRGADESR